MSRIEGFRFPRGVDTARFLGRHWQRRALFCPAALDPAPWRIDPDELLGIAMEESVAARLVTRKGDRYRLATGPFAAARLDRLPARDWTILVQSMETWEPRYHGLVALFGFLPRWRIDDVMISVAGEGGGVGPHVDQYDVFLVQVAGRRRWAWGGPLHPFVAGAPLRLLSRFEPQAGAVAGPGDVLYLPPGVPHDGVALDDGCTTLSVGFRAPGAVDLAERLAETVQARWDNDVEHEPRFGDAGRTVAADPWTIGSEDLARARAVLAAALDDPATLAGLLGRQVTLPRLPPAAPRRALDGAALRRRLAGGARLERWAGTRLAWHAAGRGRAVLFADGEAVDCPTAFARWLVRRDAVTAADLGARLDDERALAALLVLVNRGCFGFRR